MRSGGDAPNAVRPIPNTLKGDEQSDFASHHFFATSIQMAAGVSTGGHLIFYASQVWLSRAFVKLERADSALRCSHPAQRLGADRDAMIRAENYFELGCRGAHIDNAEFVFWKCNRCGAYALHDRETDLLYRDPKNLKSGLLALWKPAICLHCGARDAYTDAPDEDLEAVKRSGWGFAFF